MKDGSSFAGRLANRSIADSRAVPVVPKSAPEDPAVFGGSLVHIPIGTEVELLETGGYRVVAKPSE